MPLQIQKVRGGIRFFATIQTRASKNEITGIHNDTLKVRLTTPPVAGAANRSCIKLIAKILRVGSSKVTIASGSSSRHKIIRVASLTQEKFLNILQLSLNDSI